MNALWLKPVMTLTKILRLITSMFVIKPSGISALVSACGHSQKWETLTASHPWDR